MTYRCPRPSCDERNQFEFATAEQRTDHLVSDHGEVQAPADRLHDHEYCISSDGTAPDCPDFGGEPR